MSALAVKKRPAKKKKRKAVVAKPRQIYVFINKPNSYAELRAIGRFLKPRFKKKEFSFITSSHAVTPQHIHDVVTLRKLQTAMRVEEYIHALPVLNPDVPITELSQAAIAIASSKIKGEVIIVMAHGQFTLLSKLPLEVTRLLASPETHLQHRQKLTNRVTDVIPPGDALEIRIKTGTSIVHNIASRKRKKKKV